MKEKYFYYFLEHLDNGGNVENREEITKDRAEELWVEIHHNSYIWSEYALTPDEIFNFPVDDKTRVHTYLGHPPHI